MKKSRKYISTIWLLTLLAFSGCNDSKDIKTESEGTYQEDVHTENEAKKIRLTAKQFESLQMVVDTLRQRNMSGYVEANGQLEVPPQNEATITSVLGANIVSIEVIEGDKVEKGQAVAYLSHPSIIQKQTDYLNAYSNSEFLKKEYERQKTLYNAGVGSGANFQKAEAKYRASQSMAKGLKAQLRQLNVDIEEIQKGNIQQRVALRSPIEGFVEIVGIKTGQYVEPQTNLFEVVDSHHVHADLMVFERDVYKVKEGQKVVFNVQSIPGEELTAEIYSVGKTFEQDPKALHVHAEIENKKGNLIPGMYIQGRIQIDSNQTKAFPEAAIAKDGDRSYVFTAHKQDGDWVFVPMEVTLGVKDGHWIAIDFLESLEPNTAFAFNNAYYLMAEMKKEQAGHSH